MTRSTNIIEALKQALKQAGITYRELARELGLTESGIKQMFAVGNISLKRVDRICEVLGLDFSDLIGLASERRESIETLGKEREYELVSDIRLLLMAYCLVNHWPLDEILARYDIDPHRAINLLARLDRMGLIELLPGNRVRLKIRPDFRWVKDGPIELFFRTQVQNDFLSGDFSLDGTLRLVKNGDMTDAGRRHLVERLKLLGSLFDEVVHSDRQAPHNDRIGTTMVLAIRNWHFAAFRKLERTQPVSEDPAAAG